MSIFIFSFLFFIIIITYFIITSSPLSFCICSFNFFCATSFLFIFLFIHSLNYSPFLFLLYLSLFLLLTSSFPNYSLSMLPCCHITLPSGSFLGNFFFSLGEMSLTKVPRWTSYRGLWVGGFLSLEFSCGSLALNVKK